MDGDIQMGIPVALLKNVDELNACIYNLQTLTVNLQVHCKLHPV